MPKFFVEKVMGEPREWETAHGIMLTYKLVGSLDGADTETVSINTKKDAPKIPKVGDEIECEVANAHPVFGKTIKRSAPLPLMASSHPTTPNSTPFKDNSPSIERQVALKAAVEFAGYKIGAKHDLSSVGVIEIAERFDAFLKHSTPRSAVDVMSDPMPDYTGQEEGE